MKKKIKTTLFVFIVIGVIVLNITYKNKNEVTKTKQRNQNNLAIMIKGDSGDYVSSDVIPKGNYVLNEEKTICENGGKVVSYNNSTGQIGFSFLGSDRCSLYFDKIIDTQKPVISNLKINDKTITATLTDNQSLLAYGFSTSNTLEPTSWTSISGTTYNLSTTINTEGIYYLWVKDSVGNKTVSSEIDLEDRWWKTILANNVVHETTPDFTKVATTNEGLFKAQDDLGTSYYFRGAVNNNWVKFGAYESDWLQCSRWNSNSGTYDEYISSFCTADSNVTKIASKGDPIYWRIVRINGDGSIRMIYSGTTAPTNSTATVMTGIGTLIGSSSFNKSYDSPIYLGYMYTEGQTNGTSTSSTIKSTIDDWYGGTTLETDSATKALVSQNQIFCNDRSLSLNQPSTGTYKYYGARGRLDMDKAPILTCPTESDKFTSRNSTIGNKALKYPVGLITADEVALAGGLNAPKNGSSNSYSNSSYYLYTNQQYWLGSPNYYDSGDSYDSYSLEFYVSDGGSFGGFFVNQSFGVRPVISLSSKARLLGSGTYNDVYTVSSD